MKKERKNLISISYISKIGNKNVIQECSNIFKVKYVFFYF